MQFRISNHARLEMERRGIPAATIQAVVVSPEQRLQDRPGVSIYQSRVRFEDGKMYLVRVFVAEESEPPVIITAYRTSKIEKYWRPA